MARNLKSKVQTREQEFANGEEYTAGETIEGEVLHEGTEDETGDGGVGHNSAAVASEETLNQAAVGQLRAILERIERLEEEKKALGEDVREVYAEAKANGFDSKTLRVLVKLRKMDVDERAEAEAMLDLYKSALGMD